MSINFEGLITEVSKCCLGVEACGTCDKESCCIGYSKKCLTTSLKTNSEYIDGGMQDLPLGDTKLYDEEAITDAIGYLLNQCKNCNLYHDEDCIINIVRSSLEIILLGDVTDYNGSALLYLNDIKNINPEAAGRIFHAFQRIKVEA